MRNGRDIFFFFGANGRDIYESIRDKEESMPIV